MTELRSPDMSEPNTIRWDQDGDGIVTLTMDDPSQRANTMNAAYQGSMHAAVRRLQAEGDSVTGVIVTSAKSTFFAGGDLNMLIQVNDESAAAFSASVEQIKADLRALETLGSVYPSVNPEVPCIVLPPAMHIAIGRIVSAVFNSFSAIRSGHVGNVGAFHPCPRIRCHVISPQIT